MLLITLHNDGTGNEDIGNYDYAVYVNNKIIDKGRVENYKRSFGWEDLITKLGREAAKRKRIKIHKAAADLLEKRRKNENR